MHLDVAREMLQMPRAESSWDCMTQNVEHFIWTDDDPITSWNDDVAVGAGLSSVECRVQPVPGGHERVLLTYKAQSVEVPLTFSPDDSLVLAHTLAWLVKKDSDIRFCLDSWHSSDRALMALSPVEWHALEQEFGREEVAYRFLELPKSLQHFVDQAYSGRR